MSKIESMTGFASARGALGLHSWSWDLRSVNAKGLDLRLRVPDWIDGLEADLRKALGAGLTRGSVSLSLRVQRDGSSAALALNMDALKAALTALKEVEAQSAAKGVELAPSRAADLLALRGVLEEDAGEDDPAPLKAALMAQVPELLDGLRTMRRKEGAALDQVLQGQLTQVADLVEQASALLKARRDQVAQALQDALSRVMQNADAADPDRVAQELALIAVKQDVTEELDRLRAHVAAARDLLTAGGTVGRKLDFLIQEFNREANTLCSKSQHAALTSVGLELKAVIDQMREQVQNVA